MNAAPDYSQIVALPTGRDLLRRLPPALAGMVLIGFSIGVSVRADLGIAPWDVFHKGLSERTGISFTWIVVIVGVVVMLAWIPLHQRFGIGSLINVALIGPSAGVTLSCIGEPHALAARVAMLAVALVGFGIGAGLYIGAALGPGPRDGLMTAITARGLAVWKVRTVLEVSVLAVGWVLGGKVGVGTVVLAFGTGPITHVALRYFHLPVHESAEAHGE